MSRIQNADVSTNEVYDIAYDIAQEFEKFVLCYSLDSIKPLVDKVINALEILETAVKRNEQLQAEIEDLKSNNLHLSSEKIVSDHEKCKLKQIFEENEDSWLHEVVSLKTQLSAAKSENELLKSHLSVKSDSCSVKDDGFKGVIENQENVVRYQRALKQKEMQLLDHLSNINALNSRIQELLEANKLLHIKNQEAKNDISKLITEKNIFKSELILQKKENMLLNESIDELVHSNLEKPKCCNRCLLHDYDEHSLEESLEKTSSYHLSKEKKLLEKIKKLQAELQSARLKSQQYEENISRLNADRTNSFSKIHQFFHLFLGLTTISELCWF